MNHRFGSIKERPNLNTESWFDQRLCQLYLDTNWIALDLVKVRVFSGGTVEELAPEQLTVQRQRRLALLDLQSNSVKFSIIFFRHI